MEYMETMYARRNMVVREDFLVLNEHKNANRKSSSSDGRNAGNADKMGISGVVLWHLALKWF